MSLHHVQELLGPCPSKKMLFYWGGCVVICVASWKCYMLHPIIGIIFIGCAPFINLFFFLKGMGYMIRTFLYIKTYRKAQQVMLKPNWGHAQGGFILVDKKKQLWVANGILGNFNDLTDISVTTQQNAYYLQLNRKNAKPLTVGMKSIADAEQAVLYLQKILTKNS